jgi:tetratricopeptide (TPR) repeat protein
MKIVSPHKEVDLSNQGRKEKKLIKSSKLLVPSNRIDNYIKYLDSTRKESQELLTMAEQEFNEATKRLEEAKKSFQELKAEMDGLDRDYMEATAFKENPEAVEFQFYQIPSNKQTITTTLTPNHSEPTTSAPKKYKSISWLETAARTLNKAGRFLDADDLIQKMFNENPQHKAQALSVYKGEATARVLVLKSLTEHCKKAGTRKGYVKQALIKHGDMFGLVEWADAKFVPYPQFLSRKLVPSNGHHKTNTNHFAHAN